MKLEIILTNEHNLKSARHQFNIDTFRDILKVHPEILGDIIQVMEKQVSSISIYEKIIPESIQLNFLK